jgi:hypothetical protein
MYGSKQMKQTIVLRRLTFVLLALLLALLSAFPVQAQGTVTLDLTSLTLDGSGGLIINGILTCSEPGQAVVRGDADQQVGRTYVFGTGEVFDLLTCDPSGTAFTFSIPAMVGAFRAGRVNLTVLAYVCFPDYAICSSNGYTSVEGTFRVRPGH